MNLTNQNGSNSGSGATMGEELLTFLVLAIGGMALIRKLIPKILGNLGTWLRGHGILGAPGAGLFDLGSMGSVSVSQLVIGLGAVLILAGLGVRLGRRGVGGEG